MKTLLKPFWALARPVRAASAARLDALVFAAAARALEASDPARRVADEVGLVLDAVVAEQLRLQERVESLAGEVRALLDAQGRGENS
jgi:hypothetical protein